MITTIELKQVVVLAALVTRPWLPEQIQVSFSGKTKCKIIIAFYSYRRKLDTAWLFLNFLLLDGGFGFAIIIVICMQIAFFFFCVGGTLILVLSLAKWLHLQATVHASLLEGE